MEQTQNSVHNTTDATPIVRGPNASSSSPAIKLSNNSSFPVVLFHVLSDTAYSDIISWLPHGRSWRVLNPTQFSENVAPKYFKNQTKFASFMRQVNGWGFKRITKGPDRNAYYHEYFIRDIPDLVLRMSRQPCHSGNDSTYEMLTSLPIQPMNQVQSMFPRESGGGVSNNMMMYQPQAYYQPNIPQEPLFAQHPMYQINNSVSGDVAGLHPQLPIMNQNFMVAYGPSGPYQRQFAPGGPAPAAMYPSTQMFPPSPHQGGVNEAMLTHAGQVLSLPQSNAAGTRPQPPSGPADDSNQKH
jgi:hypothetical protein